LAKKHAALRSAIIEVLIEAREECGISQRALSRKLDESATYIQEVEAGQHRVRTEEFVAIAEAMGKDPVDLFRKVLKRRT
jgi:ribosome-binding protein aMBF1 (putative translation factor)